jgi:hypothetical protein
MVTQFTLPTPDAAPVRADSARSRDPQFNDFCILVDSAEQQPFTFSNLHADADRGGRLLIVAPGVNLLRACLGRHPNSLGDYSIQGFIGRVHVERKSMDDAHGTILGWGRTRDGRVYRETDRRARFECELANLSNVECAAVVVECSLGELLAKAPEWDMGKKTARLNRKILARSIVAWQQDYPNVSWVFADDRRQAEGFTFRWLERFHRKHKSEIQTKGVI